MEIRKIGDQLMKVTYLPPEDPAKVRRRDFVTAETIGSRPMVVVESPQTLFGRTDSLDSMSYGRKAPKFYAHG